MDKNNLALDSDKPWVAIACTGAFFVASVVLLPNHVANATPESNPDRLLVVDCLLPGQVRKLGGSLTYLAPRRPSKSSAGECEIRGGEYVAYDRANYATSLQVWLPKAKEGDPQAETYVGEIFEKGMGQPADPSHAAEWYQKAADQGFQRAMSNLAYLYEKGLGVAPDPLKALNLYRRAAGITDDQLTFESEVTSVRQAAQSQVDALVDQLDQQTQEAEQLRGQLSESQQKLEQRRRALAAAHREASQLRQQLADARAADPAASAQQTARLQQLELQLKDREKQIAAQQSEVSELEKSNEQRKAQLELQMADAGQKDASLRRELGKKSADSDSSRAQLAAAQERLLATNERVNALTAQLDAERAQIKQERDRLQQSSKSAQNLTGTVAGKQAESDRLRQTLADREAQLSEQSGVIASLQTQKKHYDDEITRLRQEQSIQNTQQMQQASEIKNVRAELAIAQERFLQTQQRLADANGALAGEKIRVTEEQDQLSRQRAAANAEQSAEISRMAGDLAKRETEVIEQRARIAGLQADLKDYSEQIARLKPQAAQVAMRGQSEPEVAPASSAPPGREPAGVPRNFNAGIYHALIIGNNTYQSMPSLETAVNDAHAVDQVLKSRYGFQTRVLENATRAQILSALNDYRTSLKDSDNLLIYYAGHGELDARNLRGYWLPVNARRDDATEWISDQMITDQIGLMAARHVLVIADSCYSGVMTRNSGVRLVSTGGTDAETKRLITLAKLPSRTVLTSGGEKPVLDGGGGANSIFAHALIEILSRNDRILEGAALWNQLFDPVKKAAAQFKVDQSPRYSMLPDAGHLNGEFLFVPVTG